MPAPRPRLVARRIAALPDEAWTRGLAWLVLLAAVVETVLAIVMMSVGHDLWGFALVGGLCTSAAVLPFLLTRTSIFSLWGPVALVVTLGTGVRGLSMATGWPDPAVVRAKFIRGFTFAELVWPAVVTVLSVVLIAAGYVVARRVQRRRHRHTFLSRRTAGWALTPDIFTPRRCALLVGGLAVVGAAATLLYLHSVGGLSARINERRTVYESGGSFQSYGQWEFLAHCGSVALITFLGWALLRHGRLRLLDWVILAALAANAFAINVITTTRTDVPYVALGALLVVHVVRSRIGLSVIAATGLIVLLGIGVLSGLRGNQGTATLDSVGSGFSAAVLNRNGYDLSKTLVIIDAVPEKLHHAYGGTVGRYVLAPIPRAIWPGKPAISEGVTVGHDVYNLEHTGVPPGITAELVWNIGRVGAVLLSFVVGLGLGLVERKSMGWSSDNVVNLVVRALVILTFGKAVMGVSMGQALSSSAQTLVLISPLVVAAYVWTRSARQRPHAEA